MVMVLYGLLCSLGVEGGLMLGLTAAEVIAGYWNKRYQTNPKEPAHPPQKGYLFNRRMHHGQIGLLLMIPLFFRGISVPAAILTGIGIGLVKDDYADIREWFHFKKRDEYESKERSVSGHNNEGIVERRLNNSDLNSDNQDIDSRVNSHGENNDAMASEKPLLILLSKQISNLIKAELELTSDVKLQSRELQKQRIQLHYRFKRWKKQKSLN
jgi:hypothetical protein